MTEKIKIVYILTRQNHSHALREDAISKHLEHPGVSSSAILPYTKYITTAAMLGPRDSEEETKSVSGVQPRSDFPRSGVQFRQINLIHLNHQ